MKKEPLVPIYPESRIDKEVLDKIIVNMPNLKTRDLLDNFKKEKELLIKKALIEELRMRLEKEEDETLKDEIMEMLMSEDGTKFEYK